MSAVEKFRITPEDGQHVTVSIVGDNARVTIQRERQTILAFVGSCIAALVGLVRQMWSGNGP